MYSDAVKQVEVSTNGNSLHTTADVFAKWKNWQASEISHHGKLCCEIAREWVTSNDFSELNGASVLTGPRWLRQKFTWGASTFPIYWCEAVKKKTLDCGALAAMAYEVCKARGVGAMRVQMVQRFSDVSTFQWSNSWSDGGEPLPWINGNLIYHEGCAMITENNELKIWDSSAGWWVDSKAKDGYGALLAVRLSAIVPPPVSHFVWGENLLPMYEWVKLNY